MSSKCHNSVAIVAALLATACGGHQAARTAPADPFAQIPANPIAMASLTGANVLLLTVGTVVVGDTARPLVELEGRRTALLAAANAQLDTALRRDAREVTWMGLEEQRRAARRNPTLGVDPDRLGTAYLFDPSVDRVPDPLWAGVRTLAAVTDARFALVPAAVRIAGTPDSLVATYVVVIADTRTGTVLGRTRAVGRAQRTPEAALAAAAAALVASPIH